jgi:hypothetical protein
MNDLYEGALGMQPSSYGNSGLNTSNPALVEAVNLLLSQPRSQNSVLKTLITMSMAIIFILMLLFLTAKRTARRQEYTI